MRRYNAEVTFAHVIPLLLAMLMVACNRAPESKEAVRQGIMDHLNKNTGLDLKAMDVDVKNVSFRGTQARATVSFKPKAGADPGMSMDYVLDRRGSQWVVQKPAGGSHGIGSAPPVEAPAGSLPPGHPPVGGAQGGAAAPGKDELPPGHPPVGSQPQPSKK